MLHAEDVQCLRQQVGNGAGRSAQPYSPGQALDLTLDIIQRLFDIGQQTPGAFEQGFTDGRGVDLPAFARQQRCANARFKVGNVQADRGRRQVQRPRRLGKGAEVGDHHQGT
ncbi:hypothetical protein D3C79_505560 [compost metagenome]